jgi:hypothetical protein
MLAFMPEALVPTRYPLWRIKPFATLRTKGGNLSNTLSTFSVVHNYFSLMRTRQRRAFAA